MQLFRTCKTHFIFAMNVRNNYGWDETMSIARMMGLRTIRWKKLMRLANILPGGGGWRKIGLAG